MTVVIIEPNYIGEEYTEDREEYENVINMDLNNQPWNNNSTWITLYFKSGSKEEKLYNDGMLSIEFIPGKTEFYCYE